MPGAGKCGESAEEVNAMDSEKGVGASLPRKEDHRLLHGRGEFVADIAMPGTMDVAFVRSPLAHARLRSVTKPAGEEGRVFTAADLAGVRPIVARSGLPGFKLSEQPVLAVERVRYAGESIAACMGETRAEAEDLASRVELDLEELPAVADMLRARDPDAAGSEHEITLAIPPDTLWSTLQRCHHRRALPPGRVAYGSHHRRSPVSEDDRHNRSDAGTIRRHCARRLRRPGTHGDDRRQGTRCSIPIDERRIHQALGAAVADRRLGADPETSLRTQGTARAVQPRRGREHDRRASSRPIRRQPGRSGIGSRGGSRGAARGSRLGEIKALWRRLRRRAGSRAAADRPVDTSHL